jgi:signal transduction histidine kinase
MAVLMFLLVVYASIVFVFQYAVVTRQIFHDQVQDVETVEGLLYFDEHGVVQLRQDYYSRPQSHLLIDRLLEVRTLTGETLYRSSTLGGQPLGGPNRSGEGDEGFNERKVKLQDGTPVMIISHLHGMQGRTLLIRLGYSLQPLHDRMAQFLGLLLLAIAAALVLAGLAGQEIAKRALRPLQAMADRAEGITASNLHERLELNDPKDELGHLGGVINHLLQRLEQAFAQLQSFTADAAHELRTPLASQRTVAEVALSKELTTEGYRGTLENILESTARLNETVDALLLLSRVEASQPGANLSTFPAIQLVDEVLELLSVMLEEKSIRVLKIYGHDGSALLRADRSLLRIALLNVLHNAIKFSPTESTITISYAVLQMNDSPQLQITVQDQGPGVSDADRKQVFERFFTRKSRGTADQSGTGLGLAISRLILERSGGEIWFEPKRNEGAACLILCPAEGETGSGR